MLHLSVGLSDAGCTLRVDLNVLSLATQGDAVVASVLLGDGNKAWVWAGEALNAGSAGQRIARA
jgi:hypothetical protein